MADRAVLESSASTPLLSSGPLVSAASVRGTGEIRGYRFVGHGRTLMSTPLASISIASCEQIKRTSPASVDTTTSHVFAVTALTETCGRSLLAVCVVGFSIRSTSSWFSQVVSIVLLSSPSTRCRTLDSPYPRCGSVQDRAASKASRVYPCNPCHAATPCTKRSPNDREYEPFVDQASLNSFQFVYVQ